MTPGVRVEEVRSQGVTAAVALATLRVEKILTTTQDGLKTIGNVFRDRSPGVYSSTVPSASE